MGSKHRVSARALRVLLALALVVPMLGLSAAPTASAADVDFVGGPIAGDYPTVVPNDHTPMALRFNATGLLPSTTYEVKVRLAPSPTPSNVQNRGYIWNPSKSSWTFNRGPAWGASNFPTVTTDPSGNITQSPWMFFKFGNELDSGTYYILITVNAGVEGAARNSTIKPMVTVLNMKDDGTRVHNGNTAVTTVQNDRRVIVASGDSTDSVSSVKSLIRSEANLVDDDANGVIDDEDYGLAGAMGDYLLVAPAQSMIDVWVQTNRKVNDFQLAGPDEDIALGAADTSAPTSPTAPAAVAHPDKISLSWTAASDDTGVTGYRVYRWEGVSDVVFTAVHELIGTTTELAFDDTTAVTGTTYYYEVRAVDAATNVSARSDTVSTQIVNETPVAADDQYDATEDQVLSVVAPGVLANDTDANGDSLSAMLVSPPAHGTLDLSADGSFTYTPDPDFNGEDSFIYDAVDALADSLPAVVTLTVGPVNDAPVAVDDSYSTNEDTGFTIPAPGVLGNDTDVDGDTLSVIAAGDPPHGSLSINGTTGAFNYTPDPNWFGTDSFDYTISDGHGGTDTATVSITVTQVNDIVALEDQAAGVTFDRWVTGFSGSYSAGTYVYGRWTNTELSARFTGSKVRWIGPKQPNYGMADVYIDGVKKATVDCYAAAGSLSETIWESDELAIADHIIKIRLTGAKNAASTGNVVVLDKFEVEGEAPYVAGTRFNEQGAGATFAGTWVKAVNPTYTASTYAYSRWSGTTFTFTFTGTKVAWIGPMSTSYGKANVYIDGALKGTIDCYSANTGWRNRIWESATLAYGSHYIYIKPTGTKTAASTNTVVVVDALDVTP